MALAGALLLAPREVTAAVLLAATAHECGHLALLAAYRVPVYGVRLGALGAVIDAPGAARLSYGRELLVTLAGPAVNLLAAPLLARFAAYRAWEWGYLLAGANLLLGGYNLLPVPPLDGARALYLLTAYRFGPDAGELAYRRVGLLCAAALTALGAYLARAGFGVLFLLAALGLLRTAVRGET